MPLSESEARKLIRKLLDVGVFVVTRHAHKEMGKDKLTDVDAVNVLRGGAVRPAEHENGAWRYRVETARIALVVEFEPEPEEAESEDEIKLVVVTAWRIR